MSAQRLGKDELPVMESFYTMQGEGHYTGSAAYFVRLAGCDVGCFWCDVKESWDADEHPLRKIEDIVEEVESSGSRIAVITGGEPALYDLSELTGQLRSRGIRTHIETSGAHALTGTWDWVCLSPKKFKPPVASVYALADELKVIVYNRHDLQWAEEHAVKCPENCLLYLQPEWDKREEMTPVILNYIRENPIWRASLQTHKYLGIP